MMAGIEHNVNAFNVIGQLDVVQLIGHGKANTRGRIKIVKFIETPVLLLPGNSIAVYWQRQQQKGPGCRRGPQGFYSDAVLAGEIKIEIASRPFPGEGYRKIWAGQRGKGIWTSPVRTLRLMRENNWLAPTRNGLDIIVSGLST